jgi:hypothetical protein
MVAGGVLTDWISLGVLASPVLRDVVDEAVAVTGRGARRSGGVAAARDGVFVMALFADEDYEEVAARLTETLRGGAAGRAGRCRRRAWCPRPAAARPGGHGGGDRAGRGAGRGPRHGRGVPGAVAADVGGRDGVRCPGRGGVPRCQGAGLRAQRPVDLPAPRRAHKESAAAEEM